MQKKVVAQEEEGNARGESVGVWVKVVSSASLSGSLQRESAAIRIGTHSCESAAASRSKDPQAYHANITTTEVCTYRSRCPQAQKAPNWLLPSRQHAQNERMRVTSDTPSSGTHQARGIRGTPSLNRDSASGRKVSVNKCAPGVDAVEGWQKAREGWEQSGNSSAEAGGRKESTGVQLEDGTEGRPETARARQWPERIWETTTCIYFRHCGSAGAQLGCDGDGHPLNLTSLLLTGRLTGCARRSTLDGLKTA